MRRPSTFKKGDLVRLVHAVQAAGLSVRRVEVRPDGGMIVVVPGGPGEVDNTAEANRWADPTQELDELDVELAEFNARHDQD